MVRSLIWTPNAERDLQEIANYMAMEDPDVALRVAMRIHAEAKRCLSPHFRGSDVRGQKDPNLRQILVMSWRLLYRIEPDRIRVVGVVHSRRLLGNVGHGFEEGLQEDYIAA